MKKYLLLVLFFSISNLAVAQKIKVKKGEVLVDKVKKYEWVKTDWPVVKSMNDFVLQDLTGKSILQIKCKELKYTQLSHESEPRFFKAINSLVNSSNDKEVEIERIGAFSDSKFVTKRLDDCGFFQYDELTDHIFTCLTEVLKKDVAENIRIELDTLNEIRAANAQEMTEVYGPLAIRKPNGVSFKKVDIFEGGVLVGRIESKEKGSYAHIFQIFNSKDKAIGTIAVFKKTQTMNVIVNPTRNVKLIEFELDVSKKYPELETKLKIAAEYLVQYGFI